MVIFVNNDQSCHFFYVISENINLNFDHTLSKTPDWLLVKQPPVAIGVRLNAELLCVGQH